MKASPLRRLVRRGLFLGLLALSSSLHAGSMGFLSPAEEAHFTARAERHLEAVTSVYENTVSTDAVGLAVRLSAFYYPERSPDEGAVQLTERALQTKSALKTLGSREQASLKDTLQMLTIGIGSIEQDLERSPDHPSAARQKVELTEYRARLAAAEAELAEVGAHDRRVIQQTEISKLYRRLRRLALTDPPPADREAQFQALSDQLHAAVAQLEALGGRARFDGDVTAADVARVVALERGTTVAIALESAEQKLARVEADLRTNLFGNDHVIDTVMRRLKDRVSGRDPSPGPLRFLLEGTTGTGRSEFEQILARAWFGQTLLKDYETHLYLQTGHGANLERELRHALALPARIVRLEYINEAEVESLNLLAPLFGLGESAPALGNTFVTATSAFTGAWSTVRDFYLNHQLEKTFDLRSGALRGLHREHQDRVILKTRVQKVNFPSKVLNAFTDVLTFNRLTKDSAVGVVNKLAREHADYFRDRYEGHIDYADIAAPLVNLFYNAERGGLHYRHALEEVIADGLIPLAKPHGGFNPGLRIKVTFAADAPNGPAGTFRFTATRPDGTVETTETHRIPAVTEKPLLTNGIYREPNVFRSVACTKLLWD